MAHRASGPGQADALGQWRLRLDGEPMYGMASLVLPVVQPDGGPTALKLQPVDWEHESEPVGLRIWDGDGIVRLLDHDQNTGAMLLERLHGDRTLSAIEDDREATKILAALLARLVVVPAPENIRHLKDIATQMVADTPTATAKLSDPAEQKLLTSWAAAVEEVLDLDRQRAARWTLARALQNSLWDIEDGETELQEMQIAIAQAVTTQRE